MAMTEWQRWTLASEKVDHGADVLRLALEMFGPIVERFLCAERHHKRDVARLGRPDDMDTRSARELDSKVWGP